MFNSKQLFVDKIDTTGCLHEVQRNVAAKAMGILSEPAIEGGDIAENFFSFLVKSDHFKNLLTV